MITLKKITNNFYTSIILCFLVTSCSRVGCGDFSKIYDDAERRAEIIDWVDKEVLTGLKSRRQLIEGRLALPGDYALDIQPPSWLPDGTEVRIVSPQNWDHEEMEIDAIFLGNDEQVGILLSKESFGSAKNLILAYKSKVRNEDGRAALLCHKPRWMWW